MAPGSHTYWKNPGEAGVPPVFSFNGSENVDAADVLYPAPTRISEEGLDAFGYTGRVVFPVIVKPKDASRAATLRLDLTFAVCNKICIPGHDTAEIKLLPRGAGQSPAIVAAALARVPKTTPTDARDLAIAPGTAGKRGSGERGGSGEPSWTLTWKGAEPLDDVIPDSPEGYYFSTKKLGPDSWSLTAGQTVATNKSTSVPVTMVLTRDGGATQFTHTFDIGNRSTP